MGSKSVVANMTKGYNRIMEDYSGSIGIKRGLFTCRWHQTRNNIKDYV